MYAQRPEGKKQQSNLGILKNKDPWGKRKRKLEVVRDQNERGL